MSKGRKRNFLFLRKNKAVNTTAMGWAGAVMQVKITNPEKEKRDGPNDGPTDRPIE